MPRLVLKGRAAREWLKKANKKRFDRDKAAGKNLEECDVCLAVLPRGVCEKCRSCGGCETRKERLLPIIASGLTAKEWWARQFERMEAHSVASGYQ